MRRHAVHALFALAALALAACGGPRAYTKGVYEDPAEIQMLDDEWNENDLQLVAKKMVSSLSESGAARPLPDGRKPAVIVGRIRNDTAEHIDTGSLADKIRVGLSQSGKFAFVHKELREDIAEEYEYQQSGYVRQDQAKGPGGQTGADYFLTGKISQNIQEVGSDKLVYYKVTVELTNIAQGTIDWTDEKEIRKKFRKRSVGW